MNNKLLSKIQLFVFLIIFSFQGISQQSNQTTLIDDVLYKHIYPEKIDNNIPLKNPGIGIEQASLLESRNGKSGPTYSGDVGPRNTSLNDVAVIRYIRSDWVSLQPKKDEYHWETLDNNINDAWSEGQQIGFSINCASPVISNTYWQNVPQWFIDDPRHIQCTGPDSPEGCTYYEIDFSRCGTMAEDADCYENFGVNHNDSVYIQAQLDLIEAIRLRYDNKEWAMKWAYIDMRNWGVWGEWQTDEARISGTNIQWPEPNWENKKAIVDAYLKFEYIPVLANYHDEDSWAYAMEQGAKLGKTVGWRTDGIDVTAWKINPAIEKYAAIRDGWKTGPIYGEVMGSSLTSEQITNIVLPRAYLWNMSGFNNKWEFKYSSDPVYKGLIDEFRAKGGYRLSVEEVIVPESIRENEEFSVFVKIKNSGTAPIYRKYYNLSVKLSPEQGGSEMVLDLSGDLTSVLPDAVETFEVKEISMSNVGDYAVSVGITGDESFNPAPLPVTLANVTSVNEGDVHWSKVGELNVTTSTSNNEIKLKPGFFSEESGRIKIFTLNGKVVDEISDPSEIENWLEASNLPKGTYLLRSKNESRLVNIIN